MLIQDDLAKYRGYVGLKVNLIVTVEGQIFLRMKVVFRIRVKGRLDGHIITIPIDIRPCPASSKEGLRRHFSFNGWPFGNSHQGLMDLSSPFLSLIILPLGRY